MKLLTPVLVHLAGVCSLFAQSKPHRSERLEAVPFFGSQHYDVPINCVGHVDQWDTIEVDGDVEKKDCSVSFKRDGRTIAVVTIFRDLESRTAEWDMENLIKGRRKEAPGS